MVRVILVALFGFAFLLPFHFFPVQNIPNDLLGMFMASALIVATLYIYRNNKFGIPVSALLLLFLVISSVASSSQYSTFSYSDYVYPIFLISGFLVAVAIGTESLSQRGVLKLQANTLIAIGLLTACYGLLRHFGVLKFLLPWVVYDTERLLGPLNQANLTALVLALSFIAAIYLYFEEKLSFGKVTAIAVVVSFSAGLTGSRAYLGFVLLVLLVPVVKIIFSKRDAFVASDVFFGKGRSVSCLVVISLVSALLIPIITQPISNNLIKSGFIERGEEETLSDRLVFNDSYRSEEWRKLSVYGDIVGSTAIGIGPGRYGVFSVRSDSMLDDPVRNGSLWSHSHNIFINILVELGYVGMIVLIIIVVYIFYLFFKLSFGPGEFFVFSVVGAIFLNNMVEFSFWFFGFFALSVSSIAVVDEKISFRFSSSAAPITIGVALFFTAAVSTAYVANDAWASVRGFHKRILDDKEYSSFLDAKKNQFIGGDAFKAEIIRGHVSLFGVRAQIKEIERYMSWRPEMVFMMRYATLKSIVGPKEVACEIVKKTVGLYPNSVERLVSELNESKKLGATFDKGYIDRCVADGMMYWIERSKG